MIVSAISLWKNYNLKAPLRESAWGDEVKDGRVYAHVTYTGHTVADGSVRIYARFGKPEDEGVHPAIFFGQGNFFILLFSSFSKKQFKTPCFCRLKKV